MTAWQADTVAPRPNCLSLYLNPKDLGDSQWLLLKLCVCGWDEKASIPPWARRRVPNHHSPDKHWLCLLAQFLVALVEGDGAAILISRRTLQSATVLSWLDRPASKQLNVRKLRDCEALCPLWRTRLEKYFVHAQVICTHGLTIKGTATFIEVPPVAEEVPPTLPTPKQSWWMVDLNPASCLTSPTTFDKITSPLAPLKTPPAFDAFRRLLLSPLFVQSS